MPGNEQILSLGVDRDLVMGEIIDEKALPPKAAAAAEELIKRFTRQDESFIHTETRRITQDGERIMYKIVGRLGSERLVISITIKGDEIIDSEAYRQNPKPAGKYIN